jgi:hypothetical protein
MIRRYVLNKPSHLQKLQEVAVRRSSALTPQRKEE